MSGMINIGGSEDPEYRYKMPRVVTKVEGSGNGIKTVLPNLQDVADALKRPPNHPLKFCGIELGALTIYDEKVGFLCRLRVLCVFAEASCCCTEREMHCQWSTQHRRHSAFDPPIRGQICALPQMQIA